jgi:hypothetical protein
MTSEEIRQIPFVFILGRGRSGTTLMQTMLDANENVVLPIESRLIVHLKQKYFNIKVWTSDLLDEFITDLYKDKKFARYWSVDPIILRKSIDRLPIDTLDFPLLCKIVYLNYPSPFKKGKVILLGDKNPIYSIFIKELVQVFPDAKFIHLVRDYRDNIASNKKVFKRQSIAQLALGWRAYNIFIESFKKRLSNNFYTLKYEDLVSQPEVYVPQICKFLGLTFNPGMLGFYETIQKVSEEKYVAEIEMIHPNILKPVNTAQVHKWKKELKKEDIELADHLAGNYARKYGYVRETNVKRISFYWRAVLAYLRIHFDFFVIRSYYKMPFFIRDGVGAFNKKLYDKFKITNYYNDADFRFKE